MAGSFAYNLQNSGNFKSSPVFLLQYLKPYLVNTPPKTSSLHFNPNVMNKYLLLRNNKQSGPYTVSELVSQGLKAYDLVWLEGKSAAWRYPSEIEELKAFAPVVEEQPFDRFYKKPNPVEIVREKQPIKTVIEESLRVE